MALAMLSVFGPAWADDDAVTDLSKPQSSVTAGAAGVSGDPKDRSLFGQYNGLRPDDAYLLLDLGYAHRDDATGTWTLVEGRDLGLESRELRALYGPQGNWKIYGEYWELTRRYPRTVNTSMDGAGTTTPSVTRLAVPGTGSDLDLKLERKRATVGGEKWITPRLMFEASFVNEDKDGSRLWGRGFTCPSSAAPTPVCTSLAAGANQYALLLLPEPISSNTKQIDAKLKFMGEKFALVAGYYGSWYDNDFNTLTPTITGNLNNPLGQPMGTPTGVALTNGLRNILQLPMALPPDNQAQQLYLDGSYAFTNTTRATFKYAYTHATQNQSFTGSGFTDAPPGRGDLGGRVDTTLAQAGITSRPIPKLSLLANVRYEDQDDKTPIDLYNTEGTAKFTNGHTGHTKTAGKAEASYALPYAFRGTAGFDYEKIDRGEFVSTDQVAGLTALRQNTYERGWRLELSRPMGDYATGRLSWVTSQRDGSTWLKPASGTATGVFPADPDCASSGTNACIWNRTGIIPFIFQDRKRDKIRFHADVTPTEKFDLQFAVEYGQDDYSGPTEKGLDSTRYNLYSVDASYAVNDNWKLTGYYSYSQQGVNQGHSTGYILNFKDKNTTAGVSLVGQASPRLKLGGDIMYILDKNVYNTGLDSGASAANIAMFNSGQLFVPDATFRDVRFKLYGTYLLQKNSDVKVEIVHDRSKLDEWTWGWGGVPWLYSDNTTVTLQPVQNVTFVSVVYTYRFR